MPRPFDALAGTEAAQPSKQRKAWTTYFPDLSNNNGAGVSMREIAHNSRHTGITAVELKATEGTGFVDQFYAKWRDESRQWGLRSFAYHFARPDQHPGTAGARAEADHFCSVVGTVRPGEWRPMLDAETYPNDASWHIAWCERVRAKLGVEPVVYSYWSFLVGMHLAKPFSAGLIFAYPNGLPRAAPCPPPWGKWLAHQYAWHGHIAGCPGECDLNWTGDVHSLLAHPAQGVALEPVFAARRRKA